MSEEYKNRGVLHKLHKVGTPSKNILIKAVTKSVLITETTALITKDAITNRFSGKEFHIHFERSQHKSGKFKTDVKIVRANAPLYKQKGIFHKLADSGRFFEGDVPFRKRQIKYSPKSKFGKVAYSATKPLISTSKFTIKAAKKVVKATALTAESAVITSSSFALNKLRQRLSYSSDTLDGGKAVLSSITAVRNLNNARKYIIRYRAERKEYSQLKQSFKAQKFKVKKAKQSFKLEKQSYKSFKQGQKKRLKTISKVYKSTNKSKARFKAIKKVYKPQKKGKLQKLNQKQRIQKNTRLKKLQRKKNLSLEKKIYKNQEKFKKLLKKQKKKAKVVPIAALPLVPVAAGTKQLTASMRQKLLMSDPNNDALQAVDKSVAVVKKTVKTAKSAKRKLQNKTEPARKSKLLSSSLGR